MKNKIIIATNQEGKYYYQSGYVYFISENNDINRCMSDVSYFFKLMKKKIKLTREGTIVYSSWKQCPYRNCYDCIRKCEINS